MANNSSKICKWCGAGNYSGNYTAAIFSDSASGRRLRITFYGGKETIVEVKGNRGVSHMEFSINYCPICGAPTRPMQGDSPEGI